MRGGCASSCTRTAPTSSRSTRSSPRARTAPGRTPCRPTRSSSAAPSSPSTGACASTATAATAPAPSRPAGCPTGSVRPTTSASTPSSVRARTSRPGSPESRRTRSRAIRSTAAGFGGRLRARPRPRRRPRDPRGAPPLDRVDRHARRGPLRHDRARHLPVGPRRRADRGSRDRPRRRRRPADELPEGADRGLLEVLRRTWFRLRRQPGSLPSGADGRGRRNEPVPQRDAHRARWADLAHRRVPARQAGQGRRVRAHQAEVARVRLRRRQDLPGRREVPTRAHRAEEHAVPLRLGRRGRVHGRVELRAALAAARADRGRAAVHAAVVVGAGDVRRRDTRPGSTCRRR